MNRDNEQNRTLNIKDIQMIMLHLLMAILRSFTKKESV